MQKQLARQYKPKGQTQTRQWQDTFKTCKTTQTNKKTMRNAYNKPIAIVRKTKNDGNDI